MMGRLCKRLKPPVQITVDKEHINMNHVFLVGNISSDIYFDHLHIKETMRPFLRLFLFCHQPREVKGLRVNLWDEKADLYYPYLQRGSRIAVVGNLISREFKGSLSHEVEALKNPTPFDRPATPVAQPAADPDKPTMHWPGVYELLVSMSDQDVWDGLDGLDLQQQMEL
ncbi:MAG: single-stranded DNA-binding protein, partial [Dehalococcoidia bacterium]